MDSDTTQSFRYHVQIQGKDRGLDQRRIHFDVTILTSQEEMGGTKYHIPPQNTIQTTKQAQNSH